ncbi:PfkB family carbohydrate kinase [Glycomyces tenuis]|uniref:PfkB family carbohydrate kinase n=1 Tax=Glycomyces tenuis TaxID=58116 RepID=UPI0003F53048|nr:PfkB family carbohydrate kinase [Glycomyces tenuis]
MKTAVTGSTALAVSHGMSQLGEPAIALEPGQEAFDLIEVMEQSGPLSLVHIGPDAPKVMLSYAEQCRDLGLEFSADPGTLDGADAAEFIEGAKFLVTSQDRYQFLQGVTGLSDDEILARVRVRVTTVDAEGVEIVGHDMERIRVPVARARELIDPAGASDAFVAGLLTALGWGMPLRRAAELGSQLAAVVLESVGTHGYTVNHAEFVRLLEESYGVACAAEASAYLLPE